MESQPQNPEFRNNLENFHPYGYVSIGVYWRLLSSFSDKLEN